jgi:glycerol-3-phosphate acyltransferase PlsY
MSNELPFLIGYFLGSIPFGLLLTRFAGGPDIRTICSGNIGATNVLRTGRKGLAAATLVCDALKGTFAVLLARHLAGPEASLYAGAGAFLGHVFPIWLKFKGGKGVATYIGVLLGLYWLGALIFCSIWLVVALVSRYSSLAALIASALTPLSLWLLGERNVAILLLAMTALLWLMHRANIARLLTGQEAKIGQKG